MRTAIVLFLCLAGCAHKRPVETYRLIGPVMVPPGAQMSDQTFTSKIVAGRGTCPPAVKKNRVTVDQAALVQKPAGWLNQWTADLESQGCIAPGSGAKLAEQIVEALPLETNKAFQLLHSSQLDITPGVSVQVVSPILRKGAESSEPVVVESGSTLTVKASANLLGYEMAWYAVKSASMGVSIVPVRAERHIGDETENRAEPETNYFRFPGDARFYRVFYESEQTEYAAVIVAARTRAELEKRTLASCDELCVKVPKQVAINVLVPVMVNGVETQVNWGTTIGGVIRTAGERETVLAKLAVQKVYRGRLVGVEFDRTSPGILNLIVTGGEVVSWK